MEALLLEKFALILVLGILAQWLAWRFKFPSIVALSLLGLILGPGLGWLNPHEDFGALVDVLVKLALAVILFEGGLNLRIHELKKNMHTLGRLVLLGCVFSWVIGTLAAHFIAGLSWPVSLVVAAILVVTGPTVIMPLIRQSNVAPRIGSLMKWEGIVNDPLGALLAIVLFEYFIESSATLATLGAFWGIFTGLLMGVGIGVGAGWAIRWLFLKDRVPDFLKLPFIICSVFVCFAMGNLVQEEAGLLAVTLFGFTLGNIGLKSIHELRQFKEPTSLFFVSAVFIVLTASLKREEILNFSWGGIAFIFSVLFIVRPLAIFLATLRTKTSWQERLILGWIAPRGVVAASMAGLVAVPMYEAGYKDALQVIPLVFGVVFSTVVLHGFSFAWLTRKLGLGVKSREGIAIVGASPWSTQLAVNLQSMGVSVMVIDSSWTRLKEPRMANIPVHYEEILSESSEQNIDFSQMGYLLAATDNDAYNALVCKTMAHEFGRNNVYQTAMHQQDNVVKEKAVQSSFRGRIALCNSLHYETLLSRFYQGWSFKKTQITDSFNFKEFEKEYEKGSHEPVVLLSKTGKTQLDTSSASLVPEPGDTLLSFVAAEET